MIRKLIFLLIILFSFGLGYSFRSLKYKYFVDDKLSSLVGNILWNSLQTYAPNYNLDTVLQRIEELEVDPKQTLTPQELAMQISLLINENLKSDAISNAKYADEYLKEISAKPEIQEIVPGKVYYEILKMGNNQLISESPTIEFIEHICSNKINKETRRSKKPFKIKLSETIKGFALGVNGMNIGEIRRIYIHPDYAHGVIGREIPQEIYIYEVTTFDNLD